MNNNELYHHGVKGQKWGVIRKFLRLREDSKKSRHVTEIQKKRKEALKKAREAKQIKKDYETRKQEALNKGGASDILQFKGDLTNEQILSALQRISLESKLEEISMQSQKKSK